jgi:hypothetical protein
MNKLARSLIFVAASLSSIALLAAACGGGGDGSGGSSSNGTSAGGAGGGGITTGGQHVVIAVEITPPTLTVEVLNGVVPAPETFTVKGVTSTGEQVDVAGTWSYDRLDVGSIHATAGAFTATGLLGGVGTVTFTTDNGVSGTATATVKLHITHDPEGIDPTIKDAFDNATQVDPSLALVYPYNKTVFPRGLRGPIVQWNGGNQADIYYVHAIAPTFEFEGWSTVPPPSRYDFPGAPLEVWRKLTDSTVGDIQVAIQRYDGVTAYLPSEQLWTIADANLTGTIYFWEVNNGNVVRIKPGDLAPENFLQKPAGVACVACHSVSKDGSRIVASFHGGYSPWGTFEAGTGASLYSSGLSSGFQAISPDGAHVLWRHWNDGAFSSTGYLSLSTYDNAAELAQLNPGGGAPSHPAWSTDGQKIAFSVRTDGNGLDFTQSTLWVTDVDLVVPSFSNTKMIVANDAQRPCVTFPTFSPDSQWIAFERSTQARSRGALSQIWLTNNDGSVQMALDATNGVGMITGDDQLHASYEPTFMPVSAGGYFWLVIVSERKYGNILEDTNASTRRKQLWVTAIDASPVPGQDPSHPAFWLPGQETTNQNMRGEWSLSPCKMLGDTCVAGYDCCGGFCRDNDGDGVFTCTDESGGCSQTGETCMTDADCCDYPLARCTGGYCAEDVPQ